MNEVRRHSIASDDVSVLSRLIDHAILAVSVRPNPEQALLDANFDMVRAAAQRPSEGNRAIDDHTVLFATAIKLCDKALHTHQRGAATKFIRVIGALLPDIRDDLSRAIENRKARPTP